LDRWQRHTGKVRQRLLVDAKQRRAARNCAAIIIAIGCSNLKSIVSSLSTDVQNQLYGLHP
jgi:hypothetical protein